MNAPQYLGALAAVLLLPGCAARESHPLAASVGATADGTATASAEGEGPTAPRGEREGGWLGRWIGDIARPGPSYALDDVPRYREDPEAPLDCDVPLERYQGDLLKYHFPVRVHPAFQDRLRRFEEVAKEVAEEVYGRPPRHIVHAGAFACRPVRGRSRRISEHALGNAIDVKGFDFGPYREARGHTLPEDIPRRLRWRFSVRVGEHWRGDDGADASGVDGVHARFLRALAERLSERDDIFRGMIGPRHRRHRNHFHFDVAPWRYDWL